VSDHESANEDDQNFQSDNDNVFEEYEEPSHKRRKYTPVEGIARGMVSLVGQKLVTQTGATAVVAQPSFLCLSLED
jgi:hypothetical protein